MRIAISMVLPTDVRPELGAAAGRDGMSLDEIVQKAMEEHLFFHRSDHLRTQMVAEGRAPCSPVSSVSSVPSV